MSKLLIVANWKANPDAPGRAAILASKVEKEIKSIRGVDVVLAPAHLHLIPVKNVLKKAKLGAQNMFWGGCGPYTGEVSWHHLKHLKIKYVIIGHSERRANLGETDEMVNKKIKAALDNGFTPILCVGERQRHEEEISPEIEEQLRSALFGVKSSLLKGLVVAYEPVWAISTNPGAKPDTSANAFRVQIHIRKIISSLYGAKVARAVRVIYGGSVNAKNIAGFLSEGKMQGALVGGASLRPEEFGEIVRIAASLR